MGALPPPSLVRGKGTPQEELERSLRPLHMAPLARDWSKDSFQSDLEGAFFRNDPCTVMALLQEEASVAPEERWAAGMEVLLRNHKQKAELAPVFVELPSPFLGRPNENSKNLEIRFFNALLYSNQLSGYDENSESPHRNPYRNGEKAVTTLRELIQEDPENGAYSFFLAQALRQMGAKKEEVEAAYIQASKAPRFETFYQKHYDSVLQLAYDNLATFAWVYTYLHSAPTPDFSSGTRNLRNWASDSDTGKWIAKRIANRLIDTGTRFKAQSSGYLYSQAEYLLGYSLRYMVDGKWEKDREDYLERMKEAKKYISETPPAVGIASIDLYGDLFADHKEDCRWAAWQGLYEAYRSKQTTGAGT